MKIMDIREKVTMYQVMLNIVERLVATPYGERKGYQNNERVTHNTKCHIADSSDNTV